jgi:predicted transcriptional regulator
MNTKKPPKGMSEPETEYRQEDDEIGDEQIERWLERNADAINASCDEAEAQIARGEWFTLEEVMASVRADIKRVAKKA